MNIFTVFHAAAAAMRRLAAWVRYAGMEEFPVHKMTDELEHYFAGERPAMPQYRYRPRSERDDELVLQNAQLVQSRPAPIPARIQLGRSDRA